MEASIDEITAWHEAGHAFAACWLGAEIESVSIDPDADDGPKRFGIITVRWQRDAYSDREIAEKSVMVALSGPVAEMIREGHHRHPGTVQEWAEDWTAAWSAATFIPDHPRRQRHLEQTAAELLYVLEQDHHWAAIGAIVDHLLAHESLEGETIHEIVEQWM